MKTTFDVVDRIYAATNIPAITAVITGKIYKSVRPDQSVGEDIVIGCLPINATQLQETVANVNIHVQNLSISIDNVQNNSQPNLKRLNELTALVIGTLKEFIGSDYWFEVIGQHVFQEPNANEHYSNIRIAFYSENL